VHRVVLRVFGKLILLLQTHADHVDSRRGFLDIKESGGSLNRVIPARERVLPAVLRISSCVLLGQYLIESKPFESAVALERLLAREFHHLFW